MSRPNGKKRSLSVRVSISPDVYKVLKRFYPDFGDASSVMYKLLRAHLKELEANGPPTTPLPVVPEEPNGA